MFETSLDNSQLSSKMNLSIGRRGAFKRVYGHVRRQQTCRNFRTSKKGAQFTTKSRNHKKIKPGEKRVSRDATFI